MKKTLPVLLVIGFMVTLLSSPALAAEGHAGHVNPDEYLTLISGDIRVAPSPGYTVTVTPLTAEELIGAITSDDIDIPIPPEEGKQYIALTAFTVDGSPAISPSLAASGTRRIFLSVAKTGRCRCLDCTTPYALSGDQAFPMTLSDDMFVSNATSDFIDVIITDNSWADQDKTVDVIRSSVGMVEQAHICHDSSGGGCDIAGIAPLAGLLILPLLLLVRR